MNSSRKTVYDGNFTYTQIPNTAASVVSGEHKKKKNVLKKLIEGLIK